MLQRLLNYVMRRILIAFAASSVFIELAVLSGGYSGCRYCFGVLRRACCVVWCLLFCL